MPIPLLAAAAIQAAPAIGGLLFGENSLFSGKARQASRELGKTFEKSQQTGIGQRYYDVLASREGRAGQGLGGQTLGLMRQEFGRGQAAGFAALKGRRSALGGVPGLAMSSADFATRLGASNEMAQRENRMAAEQTALQVAGLEQEDVLRKLEEAKGYWGGRKAESDAAISSNLQAVGSAIGSALTAGASGGLDKIGGIGKKAGGLSQKLTGLKDASMANTLAEFNSVRASIPKLSPTFLGKANEMVGQMRGVSKMSR